MNRTLKKTALLLLAVLLMGAVYGLQESLNRNRDELGLTRVAPLENAPPMLAFTTVALGGFRGLISNALWIRANDLQEDDKFFEMAQLSDWITKLEPHFVQVWLVEAWNMAYNISVKFKDYPDRWRWVSRGLELLRDEGLRYNPNETLIYRELAWFFQHKMGANLDDANMYYKQAWALEMNQFFGKKAPTIDQLIHPTTPEQERLANLLREKYKMDPAQIKSIDQEYGPLEWRLPEAHAIYWAVLGLKRAAENPEKIKPDDLITLRRVIYQSMLVAFQRGRLVNNPIAKAFEFGPNLDIIPKVNFAYEQAAKEDEKNRDHIERAHRNFLRDAVYFLYENNRIKDAEKWYKYMADKFPKDHVLDGDLTSLPSKVPLDEYVARKVQEDISETSRDRVTAAIEGMLLNSYVALVTDQDERFEGFRLLARKIWETYMRQVKRKDAIGLTPLEQTDKIIVARLLDPEHGLSPEYRAVLRTKLRMLPETPAQAPATPGQPIGLSSTNAVPATNSLPGASE